MAKRARGLRSALAILTILLGAIVGSLASLPSAGAVSPHYLLLAAQGAKCEDLLWATSHGLIDPVEVHWLWDNRPAETDYGCETPFLVMRAMGAKGTLTCQDIEWNTAWNRLKLWYEVADLLSYVPGCKLSPYALLVEGTSWFAVSPEYFASCSDINWHYVQHLISPEQAAWLRNVLIVRGTPCPLPSDPPPGSPPAPPGAVVVNYPVTPNAFCYYEFSRYGYTSSGQLQRCAIGSSYLATWTSP
jgi:hypothetical protein